ncbi:MAG: hypothetical protein H6739_29410 [Alphaproteobacteria bacterium]|nr:hypothetical protein [Alphaproteobacteria bacterium]
MLERARANSLSCPIWQDGSLVAPSSGTITIWDGSGTKQVDADSITVSSSTATYSYTPSSSLSYGEGWRIEWSLIIDSVTHVFRNDASLVRVSLYSPITDADLFRRVSSLNPTGAAPLSSVSDYQDYLDEAHVIIQNRLISRGNRPNLILSPSALREVYLTLTLSLIFSDFATRLNDSYEAMSQEYKRDYQAAWDDLRFTYSSGDEEENSGTRRRRSASPTIWLTSRG